MVARIVGLLVALLISPLVLMIATAIYLVDGSPVLFKQTRIGKNRDPFKIYKFRTMRQTTSSRSEMLSVHHRNRVLFDLDQSDTLCVWHLPSD